MTVEANERVLLPLVRPWNGDVPTRARQLETETCPVLYARTLIERWHSRLPKTQKGPWMAAYHCHFDGLTYAVALWHNPSTRSLPSSWLELRRMAVAPDAPHCTASSFLQAMARHLAIARPECERFISYQDTEVHTGTIYRAAGWEPAHTGGVRERDRTGLRVGTQRAYRTNLNGRAPDKAAKVRWEWVPTAHRPGAVTS